MSITIPMPNELLSESGEVLYSSPFTTSIVETLSDFKIHVEHSANPSIRIPAHRAFVREIGEVLSDPRIVKARQFAVLGQQANALQAVSKQRRLALLRPSAMERRHEIRCRRDKQLTLLADIGTTEDPVAIARLAGELAEIRDRLAFRGVHLRNALVRSEVNTQPEYLMELLGPRPSTGNLRVTNLWQSAAEKVVGRRVDLGVTGGSGLGLNLEKDHALTRTISSARQALGLDISERGVYVGIGF